MYVVFWVPKQMSCLSQWIHPFITVQIQKMFLPAGRHSRGDTTANALYVFRLQVAVHPGVSGKQSTVGRWKWILRQDSRVESGSVLANRSLIAKRCKRRILRYRYRCMWICRTDLRLWHEQHPEAATRSTHAQHMSCIPCMHTHTHTYKHNYVYECMHARNQGIRAIRGDTQSGPEYLAASVLGTFSGI